MNSTVHRKAPSKTKTASIRRELLDIAGLALRLKESDTAGTRERLLKQCDGNQAAMYATMYGAAEAVAELMADAAERAAKYLEGK